MTSVSGWGYLAAAIIFEVAWATCMKLSEGFTRFWPSACMMVFYLLSVVALTFSLKKFDVGTAYAIWGGVGAAVIAAVGHYYFKEPLGALKIASIGLIILGTIGLHLGADKP